MLHFLEGNECDFEDPGDPDIIIDGPPVNVEAVGNSDMAPKEAPNRSEGTSDVIQVAEGYPLQFSIIVFKGLLDRLCKP